MCVGVNEGSFGSWPTKVFPAPRPDGRGPDKARRLRYGPTGMRLPATAKAVPPKGCLGGAWRAPVQLLPSVLVVSA